MSQINVNNIRAKDGVGAVGFPGGINATGVVTATTFKGALEGNADTATSATSATTATTATNAQGLTGTPNITVGTVSGTDATFSGNLTVNGTTTTIDTAVTDVDSLVVDGSVGIGTTNPGTKLDVRGGNWANGDIVVGEKDNAGRIKFARGADGSDSGSIGFAAADSNSVLSMNVASGDGTLTFQTNSTERLRIDQHGTTKFKGPLTEKCNYDAGAGLTGDYNHDLLTYGNVHYAHGNSSGTWTYNLRGSGSVALNDMMSNGESLSFQLISSQNNTSYYMTAFKIDNNAQTAGSQIYWQGGSAPSAGGGSGYDVYTFTIFKVASASWKVFASLSNHA